MTTEEAKLNYWSGHLKQWQASGLTRKAYCEQEGLSLKSYERWTARVRSIRMAASTARNPLAAAKLTLVPVQVTDRQSDEAIALRSAAGWELHFSNRIDPAWLADVLKHLS